MHRKRTEEQMLPGGQGLGLEGALTGNRIVAYNFAWITMNSRREEPAISRPLVGYPKPALHGTFCNIITLEAILLATRLWGGHWRPFIRGGQEQWMKIPHGDVPELGKLLPSPRLVFSWLKVGSLS